MVAHKDVGMLEAAISLVSKHSKEEWVWGGGEGRG